MSPLGPIRRARRRTVRRRTRRIMRRPWRRRRRTRRLVRGTTAILLVGGGAIKLGRKDIEKIERETKKSADDLTEEELLAAMEKLGIQQLELTGEDKDAIDKAEEEE